MDEQDKVLLTVPEAAKRLNLSRTFTYELINSGELQSLKLGRARRIPVAALHEYVEAKRAEQGY